MSYLTLFCKNIDISLSYQSPKKPNAMNAKIEVGTLVTRTQKWNDEKDANYVVLSIDEKTGRGLMQPIRHGKFNMYFAMPHMPSVVFEISEVEEIK